MNYDAYGSDLLDSAVDLVNTATGDQDDLADVEALTTFLAAHAFSAVTAVTARDLALVGALRGRLRRLWETTDLQEAVDEVNCLLAASAAVPQLTAHDGGPLHLHFTPTHAPLADRVAAEAAMGLAVVLRESGLLRLRRCAAPDCGRVLVDLSRNRSRRYCDHRTCGNRLHVAAYRARQRAASRP